MAAILVGTVFPSNNNGQFRVVRDNGKNNVLIEFIATGCTAVVRRCHVRHGLVKDRLRPSIYGVGFIGIGSENNRQAYSVWINILQRCYDPKTQQKNPSYIGCTMHTEWHNFQNFSIWFEANYSDGLHIDKDLKIPGNRVYGPDTCSFVTQAENSIEAHAKHYAFTSPDGVRHEVYNMAAFSRKKGLHRGTMSKVHSGKRSHHQGWTKA